MKYNSIIILGPTGSGKTNLSLKLAQLLNGEIINADSMQIYKYLNIGTAKATKEEQTVVKHHLIDIVDPKDSFSVSDFKTLALTKINELLSQNKMPIIVGGTGFYIQSLLTNFSYGDYKDEDYREYLLDLVKKNGNNHVYNMLKDIDPETASLLHENDVKRVIRALEIFKVTGKTKSEIVRQDSETQSCNDNILKPFIIGLTCDRESLYERINKRVDIMVNEGLLNEIEWCLKYGLNQSHQSMGGIGYKELFPYFNGVASLDSCLELIKQHTRNYAKRQLTWFNKMQNINWFDILKLSKEQIVEKVVNEIKKS